jgi:hypothetical protein
VKASTTKTTSGMEAAATTKTTSGMKASSAMKTAAPAVKTTTAMARLGYVCERQLHECARKDPSECHQNLVAAHSFQHVFLHLN